MNFYYFTEKISNKKISVEPKPVDFPITFDFDDDKKLIGFKFNDDVEENDKRKLVLKIGKCLECRVKKNTPRSKKEKIVEDPVLPDQEPTLPGPPVKKEKKEKKKKEVKDDVKEEELKVEEPIKLNLSNNPPRKQRPRRQKAD